MNTNNDQLKQRMVYMNVFNLVPQYLPYMDILHQEFANYNCKTIKYLDRFSDVYVVEMTFEG